MKITNKAIHFHTIPNGTLNRCAYYDYVILGGVLCRLTLAHNNMPQLEETCAKIKNTYHKKVCIQQPFYLEENGAKFLQLINDLSNKQLIDGIIVNSPGILKYIKNLGIEIVMSRFSIGKRKKINSYFCNLLDNNNVSAIELFSDDYDLIKEIKKFTKLMIWGRYNDSIFNSFSNKCFIKNYLKKCTNDSEQCGLGSYKLYSKNTSVNNSELIISGHFVYLEDKQKKIKKTNNNEFDTVIYNSSEFEL